MIEQQISDMLRKNKALSNQIEDNKQKEEQLLDEVFLDLISVLDTFSREEKVIEELGSPAKLAETIRAGINGNTDEGESYGEYGERGYQDSRFDSSEYPAGRDDYY